MKTKNSLLLYSFFVISSLIILSACSNPHSQIIPKDQNKWDSELKSSLEKLSDDEKSLVTKYLVRMKLSETFGNGKMPDGATIGQAIAEQREFEQEVARKEEESRLLKEKLEKEKAELAKKFSEVLTVAFIGKSFIESDPMSGTFQDYINIDLGFENKGSKDIAGFKGEVEFLDIFDDKIQAIDLSYDKPIAAGRSIRWSGQINYNQFMDKDVKLRNTDSEKLKFRFLPKMIIFADGSRLEMPSK